MKSAFRTLKVHTSSNRSCSECSLEAVSQFWQTLQSWPFLEHISFLVPYTPVLKQPSWYQNTFTTSVLYLNTFSCAEMMLSSSDHPQRNWERKISSTPPRFHVSSVLMLHASLTSCYDFFMPSDHHLRFPSCQVQVAPVVSTMRVNARRRKCVYHNRYLYPMGKIDDSSVF